jgi:hypothetical protein
MPSLVNIMSLHTAMDVKDTKAANLFIRASSCNFRDLLVLRNCEFTSRVLRKSEGYCITDGGPVLSEHIVEFIWNMD